MIILCIGADNAVYKDCSNNKLEISYKVSLNKLIYMQFYEAYKILLLHCIISLHSCKTNQSYSTNRILTSNFHYEMIGGYLTIRAVGAQGGGAQGGGPHGGGGQGGGAVHL
jgi:hypothetical protein